jgi:hypothetical protein
MSCIDVAIQGSPLLLALSIGWAQDTKDYAFRRAMVPHLNVVIGHSSDTKTNCVS